MGFGSFLDIFKQDDWSEEPVARIGQMLELGSLMFAYTSGVIVEGKEDANPQSELYDRDIRINKLERKIRRRVISHLSIQGSRAEIPSGLIFMNVVKDGERIGDYVKNLYEVADMMPDNVDRELYGKYLNEPTAKIASLFDKTRECFAESDEEIAGQVIKSAKKAGRECETTIRELTTSSLSTNDAVCLVLILRFYKRLMAHMGNIATSVVMPVDMLDFYDEPEN